MARPHHIHARMFAPTNGVGEDLATGSTNACLPQYIGTHSFLPTPAGGVYRVEQGYEVGRPSLLRLQLAPRLEIGGRVFKTARGALTRE
ncbi:MAG: PhzF family phenazine biosynthesis protein [Candidatus Binatia bacterium]|nr:PhzF family phenazine biosynthesis protein [Candidatus Binatia bacterium]